MEHGPRLFTALLIFFCSLDLLGNVASKGNADKTFGKIWRKKLKGKDLATFTKDKINELGKGMLAISSKDLQKFSSEELLESSITKIFKEDDDDDDNDNESVDMRKYYGKRDKKESRRLAVGRKMKEANLRNSAEKLGKVATFLFDDADFLGKTSADDLLSAAASIATHDLPKKDVALLYKKMSKSPSFTKAEEFTASTVGQVKSVLAGMDLSQVKKIPKAVVKQSLDVLKNINFGESEARELIKEIKEKADELTEKDVRNLGKLAKGLTPMDIKAMGSEVVKNVLEDLGKVDLNPATKRILAEKVMKEQPKIIVPKLMKMAKMAEVISVQQLQSLDAGDINKVIADAMKITWRTSQAMAIMDKVKEDKDHFEPSDLSVLGKLVRGLSPSEITRMKDSVDDLANVLGDEESDLTSAQIDTVIKLIKEKDGLDGKSDVSVDEHAVNYKGQFLTYLPPKIMKKVDFKNKGLEAFLDTMSTMDTKKMSRRHIRYMTKSMLPRIDVDETSPQEKDYEKIMRLGEFALGLVPSQIRKLNGKAVRDALPTLGSMPFAKFQAGAILDKIQESDSDWNCDAAIVAEVGPLLQFAEESLVDNICVDALAAAAGVLEKRMERREKRLETRLKEGFWKEDWEERPTPGNDKFFLEALKDVVKKGDDAVVDVAGRKHLANKLVQAVSEKLSAGTISEGKPKTGASHQALRGGGPGGFSRRYRRLASSLTCSTLQTMRTDLLHVDVNQILNMEDQEFRDCLEIIGDTAWRGNDLNHLYTRFTRVFHDVDTWTNEIIRQAGVLMLKVPDISIPQMNISGVDALASVGRHCCMYHGKRQAMISRWLTLAKNENVTDVTGGELSSMAQFVCGFDVDQITQMTDDAVIDALATIGQHFCDEDQRSEYLTHVTNTFGPVSTWKPAVVGEAGFLIASLQPVSISSLSGDQIAAIRPTVIAELPKQIIESFSLQQLGMLSTNMANGLSEQQTSQLSQEKKDVLTAKMTVGASRDDESGGGNNGGGALAPRWSLLPLLISIPVAAWLH